MVTKTYLKPIYLPTYATVVTVVTAVDSSDSNESIDSNESSDSSDQITLFSLAQNTFFHTNFFVQQKLFSPKKS